MQAPVVIAGPTDFKGDHIHEHSEGICWFVDGEKTRSRIAEKKWRVLELAGSANRPNLCPTHLLNNSYVRSRPGLWKQRLSHLAMSRLE